MKFILASTMLTVTAALFSFHVGALADQRLQQQAHVAISSDDASSQEAIASLRAAGSKGLDALFEIYGDALKRQKKAALDAPAPGDLVRIKSAIDAVGQQHDCAASHLYWYTNFDDAKAAARASGKPILSLRLLGKLNEEFSCANSRFFRTTLYANSEISDYLRGHFILHWKSVRPVPRITVDFGDGRKLERTITGNSIHYVLDAEGRVIDALPGLYGPQAFLTGLRRAETEAQAVASASDSARPTMLRHYHLAEEKNIQTAFSQDLSALNSETKFSLVSPTQPTFLLPSAQKASRLAISKGRAETSVLRSAFPAHESERLPSPASALDDSTWSRLAALHTSDARLDQQTRELIRAKNPSAWEAGRLTTSKVYTETPFIRVLKNLERSIAEDTVRNEYLFHSAIHQWLSTTDAATEVDTLNAKIYAQLFLTPDSDPWLGLVQTDSFSALPNEGLITKNSN
jgi:hypothetical protein